MTDQAATHADPLKIALAALERIGQYPKTGTDELSAAGLRKLAQHALDKIAAAQAVSAPADALSTSAAQPVSLLDVWKDAYAAFKGAFGTPLSRRKLDAEYSEDARKRMREFDEAMTGSHQEDQQ